MRYSRYAIGEIVLVVIGILIALQINSWIEIRKSKKIEKNVLSSLAQDLQKDNLQILEIDSLYQIDLANLNRARSIINKDHRTLEESLNLKYFGVTLYDFNPRQTTYDEMINSGKIYNLSNKTLVENIINYYEEIERMVYETRQSRSEFKSLLYGPHLTDFWLTHNFSDSNFQEHVFNFYNNTDSKEYKIIKAVSHWSVDLCENFKSKLVHLSNTNKTLLDEIESEIIR